MDLVSYFNNLNFNIMKQLKIEIAKLKDVKILSRDELKTIRGGGDPQELPPPGCAGGTCNNVNPADVCSGTCTCQQGTCVETA